MNPILLNPKIESDKSVPEQLQQMKSYLFQFKEQMELLLMNIDSDNVSEKFEDDFAQIVNNKIMNGTQMSQILQSAGQIRLSVEELGNTVTSLSLTVNGIEGEVSDLDGNVSSLSLTVNGLTNTVSSLNGTVSSLSNTVNGLDSTVSSINGEVSRISNAVSGIAATYISKNGTYNGVTINDNGVSCTGDGSLTVAMSNIEITSGGLLKIKGGTIGGFGIDDYQLKYMNGNVLKYDAVGQEMVFGSNSFATYVYGFDLALSSHGNTILLGSSLSNDVVIDANSGLLYIRDGSLMKRACWREYSTLGNGDYILATAAG